MNKNTWIIVVVVVGILAAGGGFAGGVLYQKGQSTTPSGTTGFAGLTPQQRQQFRQGLGGRFARGGAVVGTVASSDSTSLTVKSTNGSTTTVYINGNTKYLLETSGRRAMSLRASQSPSAECRIPTEASPLRLSEFNSKKSFNLSNFIVKGKRLVFESMIYGF